MKGEKGQALPLAMMALTIGAIIIAPFLGHAGTSLIGSRDYGDIISARGAADAGVEHAIWGLTRGTLAQQIPNPGDRVTYTLGETLNGLSASVTVTDNSSGSSGAGGSLSNAVTDSLEFDTSSGYTPVIIHVSGNVYAVVYRGSSSKGYVKTFSIGSDGSIGDSVIDTLNFETSICNEPDIAYVAGTYYAIVYRTSSNTGMMRTVSIAANGSMGSSYVDSLTFDSTAGYTPSIVQVSSNYYAVAYRGSSNRGYVRTVYISSSGNINSSYTDSLTFDSSAGYEPRIIHGPGNYYVIAYRGSSNRGYLKTVSIGSTGDIASSVTSSQYFDSSYGYEPAPVQVSGNIYAVAYHGNGNGTLKTFTISNSGAITSTPLGTLVFDTSTIHLPDITNITGDYYAVAYGNSLNRGYVKTVSISQGGAVGGTVIDTLDFDDTAGYEPSIIDVSANVLAVAYRGNGSDGYAVTIGASSGSVLSKYLIAATAGGVTISAAVSTNSTAASITYWKIQ